MEKRKGFLTAFNLIAASAICNWATIFYSIHTLDWFLILWPVVPTILLIIAVYCMPREDVVNENDFQSGVMHR
jgi:asparagine N-glycosylation enzyme membrane subunit Stt3